MLSKLQLQALLSVGPGLVRKRNSALGCQIVNRQNRPESGQSHAQVWTRLDTATGEAQLWSPGVRCFTEELIFVPGAAGAEAEDDGYLLGMYYDAEAKRSCLVVRDCQGKGFQSLGDLGLGCGETFRACRLCHRFHSATKSDVRS